MSRIFFVAPLLGILSSLAVLILIRHVTRMRGVDRSAPSVGCGMFFLVFFIATMFFGVWLPRFTTHSGLGVSAETANERLLTFDIPAAATNVDYRYSLFSGLIDAADFDLSEPDFLQWMADNDRQPTAFATAAGQVEWNDGKNRDTLNLQALCPVSAMVGDQGDDVHIERGYYFDNYDSLDDDSGLEIIYDSQTKRVYVRQTTF